MKKSRSPQPPKRDIHGFDGAGHLDPEHAQRLLDLARGAQRDDESTEAFVAKPESEDDFVEELGETAVATMTSGEETLAPDLDAEVEEERGGPFVETSAQVEFAGGTDESNIEEATREPLPLANHNDEEEEELEEEKPS
ncbi:MAG: hypothetical protein M3020_25175 [Myxococcota bacterium]|jgi:hypothetical protein|nr:hypothetical protein [Myxococcota bacterium]